MYNDQDNFTENSRNYKPRGLELSSQRNKKSSVKFHEPNDPAVNKKFNLTISTETILKPL
jgi:hypothetical protein